MRRIAADKRYSWLQLFENEIVHNANQLFQREFVQTDLKRMIEESEHNMIKSNLANVESQHFYGNLTLETYISSFWFNLDQKFQSNFVEKPIQKQKGQSKVVIPEFFTSHFKVKVVSHLQELIYSFESTFMTDAQERWQEFIESEIDNAGQDLDGYVPAGISKSLVSAAFAVMVVLPLRKEIKLDLEELETKIMTAQDRLGITPRLRCNW